jgi:hypothetical protein
MSYGSEAFRRRYLPEQGLKNHESQPDSGCNGHKRQSSTHWIHRSHSRALESRTRTQSSMKLLAHEVPNSVLDVPLRLARQACRERISLPWSSSRDTRRSPLVAPLGTNARCNLDVAIAVAGIADTVALTTSHRNVSTCVLSPTDFVQCFGLTRDSRVGGTTCQWDEPSSYPECDVETATPVSGVTGLAP